MISDLLLNEDSGEVDKGGITDLPIGRKEEEADLKGYYLSPVVYCLLLNNNDVRNK